MHISGSHIALHRYFNFLGNTAKTATAGAPKLKRRNVTSEEDIGLSPNLGKIHHETLLAASSPDPFLCQREEQGIKRH